MDTIHNTSLSTINDTDTYSIIESKERKESNPYINNKKTHTKVSDSVELSDTAKLMLAVQQEINMIEEQEKNGSSEAQKKKIEELKALIASGEYIVDSKKIAKSILLEEENLFK